MMLNQNPNTIWVLVSESVDVRGGQFQELEVDQLAVNINLFLDQMGTVLSKTPEKMGKFQFVEFELSVEISAEGQVILMGTGGKAGATGGIKFVFRRT